MNVNMCICTYVYVHTGIYIMYICVHTYACTCASVWNCLYFCIPVLARIHKQYIHVYMYIYVYIYVSIYIYTLSLYVSVYTYTCMYVHVCICIYMWLCIFMCMYYECMHSRLPWLPALMALGCDKSHSELINREQHDMKLSPSGKNIVKWHKM
jgi:hypothetical protein